MKNIKIPPKVADEVIYKSDMLCVICKNLGHHIHHISGRSNNIDNLVYLCFIHHDRASLKGSLSRKLSPGIIIKYREEHYKKIEKRRVLKNVAITSIKHHNINEEHFFQLCLDAIAVNEVEKIKIELFGLEWSSISNKIFALSAFPDSIGYRGKKAILEALEDLSSRTRNAMPLEIANHIENITYNILPIRGLHSKNKLKISDEEIELFHYGVMIGFNITYDATKFLDTTAIAFPGIVLLWKILRYAQINKNAKLKKITLSEFVRLEDYFKWNKNTLSLLQVFKKQGLSSDTSFPDLPDELENILNKN